MHFENGLKKQAKKELHSLHTLIGLVQNPSLSGICATWSRFAQKSTIKCGVNYRPVSNIFCLHGGSQWSCSVMTLLTVCSDPSWIISAGMWVTLWLALYILHTMVPYQCLLDNVWYKLLCQSRLCPFDCKQWTYWHKFPPKLKIVPIRITKQKIS